MKNRIDLKFDDLRAQKKKAFVPYITAGDPSMAATIELALALERAGADIIELGVPFSDPLADGEVIQLSAQRALEGGATLARLFEVVRSIRKKSQVPLVLFSYFNPINRHGFKRFFDAAETAGADGVLILDLPPEETTGEMATVLQSSSLKLIRLIAPTSPAERIKSIAEASTGFVYYVSREGVTGMQAELGKTIGARIDEIKRYAKVPVCVGFGISNPEQARTVSGLADGVVVGSALVDRIDQWKNAKDLAKKIEEFAAPLAVAARG
jgi:tryptophan synthase alpha chain